MHRHTVGAHSVFCEGSLPCAWLLVVSKELKRTTKEFNDTSVPSSAMLCGHFRTELIIITTSSGSTSRQKQGKEAERQSDKYVRIYVHSSGRFGEFGKTAETRREREGEIEKRQGRQMDMETSAHKQTEAPTYIHTEGRQKQRQKC